MTEISDQQLDNITAAGIFLNGAGMWEVINDSDGSVVDSFGSLEEARRHAAEDGWDPYVLAWQELEVLRAGDE